MSALLAETYNVLSVLIKKFRLAWQKRFRMS